MSAYKIFISSPGDVGRERHLAEQVIRRVTVEFQDRVEVQPYFWEYEPMESTLDYQENIPLTSDFDLVICILWKRLGSPLSVKHERPDGGRWRSGTEFELVTAIESKKARGVPDIFIFKNDTKPTFEADEEGAGAKTEADLAQWKTLIAFIKEWCEREQDGQRVFTAALNRYQALDQFEQVLEKLLRGKLNERFPPESVPSGAEPLTPTWTEGSPFRGLEAFQFSHAPVFCGRTHAIGEVLDRLRRKAAQGRPFVLILGASGSGKSSLAMAGVLPLLAKPGTIEGVGLWRRVVFRPGGQREIGDLFDRLAAALVRGQQEGEGLPELISTSTTVEQLAADLRANPKATALLVKSALNQVSVLSREAEAQKLQRWIAESQAENRTGDVERYGRLLAGLKPRQARLALVIDQAEELFTSDDLNRRPELRKDFAVALDALAASGVVFVLATLRSDFYAQIQQLPAFVDLKEADGQFDLLPARPAEIAQMIRQPAMAAGLRFEKDPQTQEGLDEVLADQVKAEPRLLPLLEFALDELYKQRKADGQLTFEAYRVHLDGSIVRALAKRTDATLEGLPELSREAFRSVMRRLATTVDEMAAGSAKGPQLDVIEKGSSSPAFQRQRVPYDQLTAYPPGAKALVDAFVAARLLVVETAKADDQRAEVTVAHEALFAHWAALKNLLLAERDDLILPRARVTASYERWRAENRAADFLLPPGKQLSEAKQLVAEYGEELTPELKAYVDASVAKADALQKRRQRLLISALVVFALLFVMAGVAAIVAFRAEQTANAQKNEAERQRQAAKAETSRSEYLRALSLVEDGDADQALHSLARSLELDPSNSAVATRLINLLGQRQWPHLAATQNHPLPISILEKNADASRIIVATRSAGEEVQTVSQFIYLHDAETLHPAGSAEVGSHDITDLQVSGDRLLASTGVNIAFLLSAKTGAKVKTWKNEVSAISQCMFSNDGKWAVVWFTNPDGSYRVDSLEIVFAADGKPHLPIPHISSLRTVMMNDGEIRILNGDGSVTIQPLESQNAARTRTFPVVQDPDELQLARFGFGGNVLLGVRRNGEMHIWRLLQFGAKDSVFTSNGLTLLGMVFGNVTAAFHGADQVTIVAQDPNSSLDSAHSCVTRIARGGATDPDFKVDTDWHSPFRLVCVLSPGIAVAQATKAFVLPFHGGSLSGPVRHDSQITAICGIKEGLLATGAADGAVKLWNLTPPAFVVAPQSGPVEKRGTALLAQSRSRDVEIWGSGGVTEPISLVINRGGKDTKVQMPRELLGIGNVELSADGKRGIFSGYGLGRPGSEGSGAWIFSTKDGRLVSESVGICEWAGFTPDAKQVLTINHGSLHFWNLRQDEKGPSTFEATSRVLPQADTTGAVVVDHPVWGAGQFVTLFQAGMTGAVVAEHGSRLATRSRTGDVLVWDGTEGKPLHLLRGDPLWNDADLNAEQGSGIDWMRLDEQGLSAEHLGLCKPALSAEGRRLATAYGRAFVIWDVDSAKPLSDPIYCAVEIQYLDFPAGDPTKVQATLRDGSKVSWDYADLGGPLAQADATALRQLAMAVADDKWVDEAPRLAADARPSSPAVTKLLEHFASQARALRANALKPAPAASE
jgi:WD40 repeat protein